MKTIENKKKGDDVIDCKKPLVSIIIPVYNVEFYIKRCLDSLLLQTYTNIEVLMIDDGSEDKSGVISDEYASIDSRFRVIHSSNEGVAKARLKGFESSQGDIITFIDSDDYVCPTYVETLLAPIVEQNIDMVSCDYFIENESTKENAVRRRIGLLKNKDEVKDFLEKSYFYDIECHAAGMPTYLWGKMIKRSLVVNSLSKGIDLWFGEDQIVLFDILTKVDSLCLLPDRLYNYVQREGQATQKYSMSLWNNIIRLMESYVLLSNGTCRKGIRQRTMLYIWATSMKKMMSSQITMRNYVSQMKEIRNQSYIKDFFKPYSIELGLKYKLFYQLLKYKLYYFSFFMLRMVYTIKTWHVS